MKEIELDMELSYPDIHKIKNYKPSMKGKYIWVDGKTYQEIGTIKNRMTYDCLYRKDITGWHMFTFDRKFVGGERAYIISEEEMYTFLF